MNASLNKNALLRCLSTGAFEDLERQPDLGSLLSEHAQDVWVTLTTNQGARGVRWAHEQGLDLPAHLGQTLLVQVLLNHDEDTLVDCANALRAAGASLPEPPETEGAFPSRQFTLDRLWQRVIDRAQPQPAILWLAAQECPVQFQRLEPGTILGHALLSHREKALPVVEALVEAGADVHEQDSEGENALHTLARMMVPDENQHQAWCDLWQYLVEAGAQPDVPNNADETPMALLLDEYKGFAQTCNRVAQTEPAPKRPRRNARA